MVNTQDVEKPKKIELTLLRVKRVDGTPTFMMESGLGLCLVAPEVHVSTLWKIAEGYNEN